MTSDLPGADPASAAPADLLEPLRAVERSTRRLATRTVLASLAGVAAAATVPLWSAVDRLRPVIAGTYIQQTALWQWDIAPRDAWWAFGLVLLLPCVLVVWAAVLARRRLTAAAAAAPFQVRLAETTAGPGVGRLTDAQRRARERGRREELLVQQRYVVQQTRKGSWLWAEIGATFAFILGVWVGSALVLAALGLQATMLGIAMAATSWGIVVIPVALWYLVPGARRALARRRAGTAPEAEAPPTGPSAAGQ